MTKKYRLKVSQMGLPAGTEFVTGEDGSEFYYCCAEFPFRFTRIGSRLIENNPDLFEPVIERWKPKPGCVYYVLNDKGEASRSAWSSQYDDGDAIDQAQFSFGNCFQTEDEAKEAAKRIQAVLLAYQAELGDQ